MHRQDWLTPNIYTYQLSLGFYDWRAICAAASLLILFLLLGVGSAGNLYILLLELANHFLHMLESNSK